jgi:hypothetical protein
MGVLRDYSPGLHFDHHSQIIGRILGMKIVKWEVTNYPGTIMYVFNCPGCKFNHPVHVAYDPKEQTDNPKRTHFPCWTFNGDLNRPTFTPSLLVNPSWPQQRCHSFITDGKIQFLDDCWHDLKGKTVELPEYED